jgi:hypothetical protein
MSTGKGQFGCRLAERGQPGLTGSDRCEAHDVDIDVVVPRVGLEPVREDPQMDRWISGTTLEVRKAF